MDVESTASAAVVAGEQAGVAKSRTSGRSQGIRRLRSDAGALSASRVVAKVNRRLRGSGGGRRRPQWREDLRGLKVSLSRFGGPAAEAGNAHAHGGRVAGKHLDLVDHTKRLKAEAYEFYLDLTSWRKFRSAAQLNWQKLRFGNAAAPNVPQQRGIYAFTVELDPSQLPAHGYIMYVGITGNKSNANLRRRFNQYLANLRNKDGRPRIYFMLDNWKDHLFFNFVPISDKNVDLVTIERDFLNAVMPPANQADFGGRIMAAKAAKF